MCKRAQMHKIKRFNVQKMPIGKKEIRRLVSPGKQINRHRINQHRISLRRSVSQVIQIFILKSLAGLEDFLCILRALHRAQPRVRRAGVYPQIEKGQRSLQRRLRPAVVWEPGQPWLWVLLLAEEELQRRVPHVSGKAVGQLAEVQQLGDFVCEGQRGERVTQRCTTLGHAEVC